MSKSEMTGADFAGNIEVQLREQGFYVSTTVGYSMWPMLKNRRDRVVLRAVQEGETLRRGDVPLYVRPSDGKHILHRILAVKKDHYVIRGDNTYKLERVPQKWVIGTLSEFYRKGKHVSVTSKMYRFYVGIWRFIYPLRYVCHGIHQFCFRVKRKLAKIFKRTKKQ